MTGIPNLLYDNGMEYTTPLTKAHALNQQFSSVFSKETPSTLNSFPLILRVKGACFHLTIKFLLHARVLTLICVCPIFKANFSHYNIPNANLRNI